MSENYNIEDTNVAELTIRMHTHQFLMYDLEYNQKYKLNNITDNHLTPIIQKINPNNNEVTCISEDDVSILTLNF